MFSRASKDTTTANKTQTTKTAANRQSSATGARDLATDSTKEPLATTKRQSFVSSNTAPKPPSSTQVKPNITKSQQSYEKNKQQTDYYMGLIKERGSGNAADNSRSTNIKSSINSSVKKETPSKYDIEDEQDQYQMSRGDDREDEQKIVRKPQQGEGKSQKESQKMLNEIEQLKEQLNTLNRTNYEQGIKLKEEKIEQKRLKGKISQLEQERSVLLQQLKEKDQIIQQGLAKMKDQFTDKRNFLIQSQMIKQRRYIQHLTKLTKSNRNISTEIEYQLDYIRDLSERACNESKKSNISAQTEQKFEMTKQNIINLRNKFDELTNQTSYSFSQNLLKEFDVNSDKEISKQTFLISLEQSANKLYNSSLQLTNSIPQQSKESAQTVMDIKEFIEGCLRYGMDIQMGEDEYEVIKSNEEIRNDVLRNVKEKVGGFEASVIDNVLYNGQLFEFLHKIQLDRNQLVHRYKNSSATDIYLSQLINSEFTKKMLKQNNILNKIKECIGFDVNILNKMNNILRVLFFQSQISLHYLNEFVDGQLNTLYQIITECIYKPFQDMYEIYEKYHKSDKNNNYPIHLAQIFNMNCESMKVNIESIVSLQNKEVFKTNRQMNIPLITQIQKVYQDISSKLEFK